MRLIRNTAASVLALSALAGTAFADAGHAAKPDNHGTQMMGDHMQGMMGEGMLALPQMDPARGRKLFAEKGCVVCHSINGIGGEDALRLDASTMSPMMNPFEFAARMWRGAEAMVMMQRDELGDQVVLSGQELADIIAFVHSHKEQAKFSEADVPENIMELIEHEHGGGAHGEMHEKMREQKP